MDHSKEQRVEWGKIAQHIVGTARGEKRDLAIAVKSLNRYVDALEGQINPIRESLTKTRNKLRIEQYKNLAIKVDYKPFSLFIMNLSMLLVLFSLFIAPSWWLQILKGIE